MTISDSEMEQQLIGALFAQPKKVEQVSELLAPEDFSSDDARSCFIAMQEMARMGVVSFRHTDLCAYRDISADYVAQAMELMPGAPEAFAEHVRRRSTRRQAYHLLRKHLGTLNEEGDTNVLLSKVVNEIDELRARTTSLRVTPTSHVAKKVMTRMAELKAGHMEVHDLPGAFAEMSAHMGGLMPGRIYVVAARPSVGKTATALEWSFFSGARALFVSSEMTEEDLFSRLLSRLTRIPQNRIDRGNIDAQEWELLEEAKDRIVRAPFQIMSARGKSVDQVAAAVRGAHRQQPFDLVVHDYLQLFRKVGRTTSEYEHVSEAILGMKNLALQINRPVIQLSQLNRGTESRRESTPQLSDLRGSGAIEQDADAVIFIHRPAVTYNGQGKHPHRDDPDVLEYIIEKNRSGPRGRFCVRSDFESYRFEAIYAEGGWSSQSA